MRQKEIFLPRGAAWEILPYTEFMTLPPRKANRLGQAFRQCAITVRRSESWLGAKHRHRLARMEKARAIKATAHEIARLVYAMLRDSTEYVERSIADFEKAHQDRKIAHIRRQAHAIGCVLVPVPTSATG